MATREEFTIALAPTLREDELDSFDRADVFRSYLAGVLERPVQFTRFDNYQQTIDALRSNDVDAAMVGDYVSRQGEAIGDLVQLVSPVSPDQHAQTYRSVIVTRIDSGIRELSQLPGARMGLVDGQSTSGYLVPRAMLREADIDPDRDVSIQLYGSHREVMEAVIAGDVDAGAAHENRMRPPSLERGPDYARLRVLTESRPIPNGPLVVRTSLDHETREKLAAALLRIHEVDPEAAKLMLRSGNRFTLAAGRSNPTLKSVAELAGVSYATVSRVINKSGYVAPQTATRVQAIIDELGYAPNGHARVLMGRKSPLIGFVTSLKPKSALPGIASLLESLRIEFQRFGVPIVICPVGESLTESPFPDLLRDKRLGALIVGPDHVANPDIVALARTGHIILAIGEMDAAPGIIRTSAEGLVASVLSAIGTHPAP